MSFQAFVVPGAASAPSGVLRTGTAISWKSEIAENTSFVMSSDKGNDNDVDYINDYMSTSRYVADSVGSLTLTSKTSFDSSRGLFDNFALAGVNWNSAGISQVNAIVAVLNETSGLYEDTVVASVDTSLKSDYEIVMMLFDEQSSPTVKVQFIATGIVEISMWYAGKSFRFPSQPNDGFQPGRWNNLDTGVEFRTITNEFGPTIIENVGTEEVYDFSFLPQEFMNDEFAVFIKEIKDSELNPVFSMWNPDDFQDDVIFGRIDIRSAKYQTRIHGSVGFTIVGIQ